MGQDDYEIDLKRKEEAISDRKILAEHLIAMDKQLWEEREKLEDKKRITKILEEKVEEERKINKKIEKEIEKGREKEEKEKEMLKQVIERANFVVDRRGEIEE